MLICCFRAGVLLNIHSFIHSFCLYPATSHNIVVHAICAHSKHNSGINLVYKYNCLGKTCDLDIDECLSSPCVNNGSCEDLVNGYRCYCLTGFTGAHCENTQECTPVQCRHGSGVFQDGVCSCSCITGYAGNLVFCSYVNIYINISNSLAGNYVLFPAVLI